MWSLRTYIAKTSGTGVTAQAERVDADRVRLRFVKDGVTVASAIGTNAEADALQEQLAALKPQPPAAASRLYWGARMDGEVYGKGDAPWDKATWDTFEAHAGRKVSLVSFGQPPPWSASFTAAPLDLCFARGAVPMMDMQIGADTLADIVAGKRDAAITTWAKTVKTYGRPFLFRWCHEMNGTWYAYGAEAAKAPDLYVQAWKRWHGICAANGATNVTWVWCPNVIFPGSTAFAGLYPGDPYVDWLGIDGYNFGGAEWRSPAATFRPTYDSLTALAPGKPIVICETGCAESGGDKAAWIRDLYAMLPASYPAVRAISWFNWNIVEGGSRRDWQIESSPAAQAAFAAAVSSSVFAANDYGALTGLSRVKPPA